MKTIMLLKPAPHAGGDPLGDMPLIDESTLPDAGSPEAGPAPSTADASGALNDQGGSDDPPPEPQHVPLAALHEERALRKAATERAEAVQQTFERVMAKIQAPEAPQQQQQAPTPVVIPEFVDDPQGHINARFEELNRNIAAFNQFAQGVTTNQQQQMQHQQIMQHGMAAEAEYTKTVPDYPKAVDHLINAKKAEYTAYGLNAQQVTDALTRDFAGVVQLGQQTNQNPADIIYKISKSLGYNPGAAPPVQQQQQPTKQPNTSLSSIGGGKDPDDGGKLTLDSLAAMSDADFDKMFDQMSKGSTQGIKV